MRRILGSAGILPPTRTVSAADCWRTVAQAGSELFRTTPSPPVSVSSRPHWRGAHACCRPRSRCPGDVDRSCTLLQMPGSGTSAPSIALRGCPQGGAGAADVQGVVDSAALASSATGAVPDDGVLLASTLSVPLARWPLLAGASPLGCVRFRPGTDTAQPRLRRRKRLLRSGPRHARHARARPARGCACLRSSLRRG